MLVIQHPHPAHHPPNKKKNSAAISKGHNSPLPFAVLGVISNWLRKQNILSDRRIKGKLKRPRTNHLTTSSSPRGKKIIIIKEQFSIIFHRNCHRSSLFLVLRAQMRWITFVRENGWAFYICSRVEKREKAMPT